MSAHLGDRVSALLDGQLAPAAAEQAWLHVHACHQCRDLVERESWVKRRLAGLAPDPGVPDSVRGHLLAAPALAADGHPAFAPAPARRVPGLGVALGAGAVLTATVAGAWVLTSTGPSPDRQVPTTSITGPSGAPSARPSRTP